MVRWNGVSISGRFRDIGMSWPLESRDVVGQVTIVTILHLIGHFLFVVLWNQASISNGFRDIQWRI